MRRSGTTFGTRCSLAMSAQSTASRRSPVVATDAAAEDFDAARARARERRRLLVFALRVALAIVILGSWELTTRVGCHGPDSGTCVVDPFFFGQPSGIWSQLVTWVEKGTAQGSLWEQIAVTLEETVLGF